MVLTTLTNPGLVDDPLPYTLSVPSRYNIFTGCPEAKTCTLILRGGAEQFIEETERSLHDAIMIVRRTIKNDAVVAGEWVGWWVWSRQDVQGVCYWGQYVRTTRK